MALRTKQKSRRGDKPVEVVTRTIGNATVVHLATGISRQAQAFAMRVAPDAQHELVVLDVPQGGSISLWEAIATTLPRGRRGLRLVIGGRGREATTLAAQWLAERLGRSVVAPDGAVLLGVGGSLFVHSGRGSGWVRFQPGKSPQWEAKRFPRPSWDASLPTEDWPTSSRGLAEPIPGGIWIRPVGHEVQQRVHRGNLIEGLPCQDDVITVVLGCPGSPPVSLDDVARLWITLSASVRERLRFVQFGPVVLPSEGALGQVLADLLGEPVACYTGMPLHNSTEPEVYTVGAEGDLGWPTFARELAFQPRAESGEVTPPSVLSHRRPIPNIPEISPAVYWYAPDAVIEVVQSGLWVRKPGEPSDGDAVRSVRTDQARHNLVFEADRADGGARMRQLAQDVLARLDEPVRRTSRLVAAHTLVAESVHVSFTGRAMAAIGSGSAPAGRSATDIAKPVTALDSSGPKELVAGEPVRALADPALAGPALAEESRTEVITTEAARAMAGAPAVPEQTTDTADTTAVSAPESGIAPPISAIRFRLESTDLPEVDPPTQAHRPEPAAIPDESSGTGEAEQAPTEPDEVTPQPTVTLQPTPAPEASALLPQRDIEQERGWLRRTLAQDFGTLATSVGRILSEHPGFQGAMSRSPNDVLTDAVAVRLHLSPHGEAIDLALRTGTVGPHVPFARCVVSGLSRLPSHRGPTVFTASPSPAELAIYRDRTLLTEWGFTHALTGPCADQRGTTDVLIWSMTARRTKLLEPDDGRTEDRVLFVPGTTFKILRITEPAEDGRWQILLRELSAAEIGADGRVDTGRVSLDDLAVASLERQAGQWAKASPAHRVGASALSRFGALPGLR
jgi:hypothetical protein